MDSKYKVGGYVKLAKLWERSKDAVVAYHSSYYAEKFKDDTDKELFGVYIDITGKGFVGIHPNWSGINDESIRSLCLSAYMPEEVVELNAMADMRAGKKQDSMYQSEYLTASSACFINHSSPVITIAKNEIRFSKAYSTLSRRHCMS